MVDSRAEPHHQADHANDVALLLSAHLGERKAEEALVARLGFVSRFLRSQNARLGRPFNGHDLEDLEQEVLARTWSQLATFRGQARLESWVGRVCVLTLLDWLRKRGRIEYVDSERFDAMHRAAPDGAGGETEFEHPIFLPEEEARFLYGRLVEDLSYTELGRRYGVSRGTARLRCSLAVARISRQLGTNGGRGPALRGKLDDVNLVRFTLHDP